jgi:hypothetical protein
MTDYVEVNGAKIERTYLEENVSEAKKRDWSTEEIEIHEDHVHCVICDLAMAKGSVGFCSDTLWLCRYCMEHFIATTN